MGEKMKKIIIVLIVLSMSFIKVNGQSLDLAPNATASILIEANSKQILNAKNETEKLFPASTTKIMTMILMFEAIHSGQISFEDQITTSSYASSMGGSQVYLEENETMSLHEMFKCMAIGSANDATVAIGECIAGTNDAFVKMMNDKAKELKLVNTQFKNATGLHDPEHYSCAYDLAMMAAYLIEIGGDELLEVTSTYDTYIRENTDQKFWLVNTNKLLNAYTGLDGLKTGYTKEAGYCLVTTAKKDDLRIIGVVMQESDPKSRNKEMCQMLDYGFNLYENKVVYKKGDLVTQIDVYNSEIKTTGVYAKEDISYLVKKGEDQGPSYKIRILKNTAPFVSGEIVGQLDVMNEETVVFSSDLIVNENIAALTFVQKTVINIQRMFQ